ncbi:unnamed protein product, partial [Ectocarpus sp. 12 AP-2014]
GSLEGFQAAAGGHQAAVPTRRPGGRSPSPSSGLKRRASFPASVRSWNLIDHRGGGRAGRNSRSRSPGSPSSVGGRALDDAHDQQAARSGGSGALTRRSSTPPSARPGFSGAGGATSENLDAAGAAASEPPLFATVAQFCTLGVAEESGAAQAAAAAVAADAATGETDAAGAPQSAAEEEETVVG